MGSDLNRRTALGLAGAALSGAGLAAPDPAAAQAQAGGYLAPVVELLRSADALAEQIGYPPPELRGEYHRFVLMMLAGGYDNTFGMHVDQPLWVPYGGVLFPWAAANPDDIYLKAAIDGRGTYRLSGVKGTETLATLMMLRGGTTTGQAPGPSLGEIDMTQVETDKDRRFSLTLSAERPPGVPEKAWRRLDPLTTSILARGVITHPGQTDSIWCWERLDRPPASNLLTPEGLASDASHLATGVPAFIAFNLKTMKKFHDAGAVNGFVAERFSEQGGMPSQMYYHSLFEIAPDEALVIESALPEKVRYWGVQLFDQLYNTIDFYFHQSSLNDHQVRLDADGKARLVLSLTDPGVPNWLDPGGLKAGGMMWRWHTASSFPLPTVTKVKLAELRRRLPPTPVVTPAERRAAISERAVFYQSRRRW
jgi:hypothetical protein